MTNDIKYPKCKDAKAIQRVLQVKRSSISYLIRSYRAKNLQNNVFIP